MTKKVLRSDVCTDSLVLDRAKNLFQNPLIYRVVVGNPINFSNQLKKDFKEITRKASLVLKIDNNSMRVHSEFELRNRFNIGMLLILACSVFVISFAIVKGNGIALAIVLCLGIGFFILSLLAIIKQFTDFLLVTDREIVFRNSLRKKAFPITRDLKVKTSKERVFTKASRFGGSYSRQVELFIKRDKIKYRIFDFSMEDDCSEEADYLRKTIKRFIKRKIEDAADDKS